MDESLFGKRENNDVHTPLAVRMRPRTLDEFVGQEKAVGPGTYLRSAIEADKLQSAIFYGPPGTGKTTLARIISTRSGAAFEALNAVMDGLPELRKIVERARKRREIDGQRTLLFVDEIHRFNKTQQDGLLPHVLAVGLTVGLIMLQPDMGTGIAVGAAAAILLFAGNARLSHLFITGVACLPVLVWYALSADYRRIRLTGFLHPNEYKDGVN